LLRPISKKVRTIKFTIVPSGSGTVGKIIAGVALIGLAFMGGIPMLGMSGLTAGLLGGSLILGAIFGQQKSPQDQEKDGKKSNVFSRPQQTLSEGGRIPVVYGVHLCGWTVVSARVRNYLV
jgi:predicted phage tail protein